MRLIAPQFVKPHVKSNKNGATMPQLFVKVSRPQMRFVSPKSVEQQDIQSLHRVRSRLVSSRTQLANQVRGLLTEYGVILPQHVSQLRHGLPLLIEDAKRADRFQPTPICFALRRRNRSADSDSSCCSHKRRKDFLRTGGSSHELFDRKALPLHGTSPFP